MHDPGYICVVPDAKTQGLACYLWPPKWVGGWEGEYELNGPDWPIGKPMEEAIVTVELPHGIRARAFRDGMIAFVSGPDEPPTDAGYLGWIDECVRLMNAHLACLASVLDEFHVSAVVAPLTTLPVIFETGKWNQGANSSLDGGTRLALYFARKPEHHPMALTDDWRFLRVGQSISAEEMQMSFERLRELLERPAWTDVLLRAELLHRARASLVEGDFSGSLVDAWAAIEAMLGTLLKRYLDAHENRDVGTDASGNALKFINGDRRRFFGSAQMTVRHTIELLSLLDLLEFPLYRVANDCEKARNNWLHRGEVPSRDQAWQTIHACGELFAQVEGVSLSG